MSTTPKRYRLRKDLPDGSKPGDIYCYVMGTDLVYKNDSQPMKNKLIHNSVENNPEWFELITETPTEEFKWTDELVKQFIIDRNNGKNYAPVHMDSYIEKFKQSKSNQSHIPKDFSLEEREVKTNLSTQSVEKQRDWEIVSLIADDGSIIYFPSKEMVDLCVSHNGERIHSVRRLSDNLLIEVGKEYSYLDKPYKILSLEYVKAEKNGMFGRPVSEAIMAKINQNERVNILSLEPSPTPPKERIEEPFIRHSASMENKDMTSPPQRIRVGDFCYIGSSIDALRLNTRYYEYSFKTTKAIDPSLGLIGVIEKAINQ